MIMAIRHDRREEGVLPSALPPVPSELERLRRMKPEEVDTQDIGSFTQLHYDLHAQLQLVTSTLASPRCPIEYNLEGNRLRTLYQSWVTEVVMFLKAVQEHREKQARENWVS